MEAEDLAEAPAPLPANRRAHPRLSIEEDSVLLLLQSGAPVPCRILDLSMEGCRVCTRESFPCDPRTRVEITFKADGLAFRLSGVTQWTDERHQAGIRFLDVPARRRRELAEALDEIWAAGKAKAAIATVQEPAPASSAGADDSQPHATDPAPPPARKPEPPEPVPPAPNQSGAPARCIDRRANSRYQVDTSAIVLLVKIGSTLHGSILDLSLNGCRMQTREPFPVGIYTRVEMEFRLYGLPFRLAGVVRAIHATRLIGIQFIDMSGRKRRNLTELIEAIKETRKPPETPAASDLETQH
jgi:hypothetical protein